MTKNMHEREAVTNIWNAYTNFQTPQEFMTISRQKYGDDVSVQEAVGEYAKEYMRYLREWRPSETEDPTAGVSETEFSEEDLARSLSRYLELTQGSEWR